MVKIHLKYVVKTIVNLGVQYVVKSSVKFDEMFKNAVKANPVLKFWSVPADTDATWANFLQVGCFFRSIAAARRGRAWRPLGRPYYDREARAPRPGVWPERWGAYTVPLYAVVSCVHSCVTFVIIV